MEIVKKLQSEKIVIGPIRERSVGSTNNAVYMYTNAKIHVKTFVCVRDDDEDGGLFALLIKFDNKFFTFSWPTSSISSLISTDVDTNSLEICVLLLSMMINRLFSLKNSSPKRSSSVRM